MAQPARSETASSLAERVYSLFGEFAIDKRRLPASQLTKRGVPGYVAEWVLQRIVPGTGALPPDDAQKVQDWSARAIPGANDQNIIKERLLRGETVKILTPVQVDIVLTRRGQDRVGKLAFLDITDAIVGESLCADYPELLRGGMWGVTELINSPNGVVVASFQPMQAQVNLRLWKEARSAFTLEEWRELLLLSMGYSPSAFTSEEQDLVLCRLLPLVQKNMHLLELAPKGTGKSYVYENISPKVRVVSGGNVSPAVLFVNNANGLPGILARYSVVVLDEVQRLRFEKPEEIVAGLKGYLANGRLTRGGLHELASDCGLVLLANIMLDESQRPLVDPLVRELPAFLRETAFLDRIRGLIPGWEIGKLTSTSFAESVGLKSDFFGDVLIALRDDLTADQVCTQRIGLVGSRTYVRNAQSVRALASGLMKLLFPDGQCTDAEFYRYCVQPAVRLRQGIWDQLYALDAEYRQYDQELRCELVSPFEPGPATIAGDGGDGPEAGPTVPPGDGSERTEIQERIDRISARFPEFGAGVSRAQQLATSDPSLALVEMRRALEAAVRSLYRVLYGDEPLGMKLFEIIRHLEGDGYIADAVRPHIHTVRMLGNTAAHEGDAAVTADDVEVAMRACVRIGEWIAVELMGS